MRIEDECRCGVQVYQMYKEEANLQIEDIAKLLQRFGNQQLDFFGAIRANTYDEQILCDPAALSLPLARALVVHPAFSASPPSSSGRAASIAPTCRQWIRREVCTEDLTKEGNLGALTTRLVKGSDLPDFEAKDLSLDALMEEGDRLVYEARPPSALRRQRCAC